MFEVIDNEEVFEIINKENDVKIFAANAKYGICCDIYHFPIVIILEENTIIYRLTDEEN